METRSPRTARAEYYPLVPVLIAVAAGIVCDSYLAVPLPFWLAVGIGSLLLWFLGRLRTSRDSMQAALLLIAAASLAGAWHHRAWYLFPSDDIGFLATLEPQPVVIDAFVQAKPQRIPAPPPDSLRPLEIGDRTRMLVTACQIREEGVWRDVTGNVTVVVNGHLLGVLSGDRVQIVGNLAAPAPASNPGEFDFAEFCRGNRILATIRCRSPQSVTVLERGSAWRPQRAIDGLRSLGEKALWKYISPENAGLAAAMFLGLREEIDPELADAFRETGTIHLLVISGLNVGILAWCVLAALRTGWLSHRAAMYVLVGVTVSYALITDAQPPVVRATVLVTVFCIAQMMGRQAVSFNTLAAAALIVLAINPVELFRPGTQLSFLAVGVLVVLGRLLHSRRDDPLNDLIMQARSPRMQLSIIVVRALAQMTLVSFAVWLVVQPLVAAKFNLISPSAIVLGPFLAIPVAIAMATGFAVMAFGWLIPPLGALCGFACDRCLTLVVHSIELAREMPYGRYWTSGPSDWWLLGFYALLTAAALLHFSLHKKWKWFLLATGFWCSLLFVDWRLPLRPSSELQVTVLSVGHGLAVVAELPDGRTMLYDAGCLSSPEFATRAVSGYLFSRRIHTIDQLIISHADADHYNALPSLLTRFAVREACYTRRMFRDDVEPLRVLQDALANAGVRARHISSGDVLYSTDLLQVKVLHPPATEISGNDNASSAVLQIDFGKQRLLLTGDIESPGLEMLLDSSRPKLDVLLVPHHGSLRSRPEEIAQWAAPRFAVISGSFRDRSATVSNAYRSVGAEVYHTSECGAVQFRITADSCSASTFRRR